MNISYVGTVSGPREHLLVESAKEVKKMSDESVEMFEKGKLKVLYQIAMQCDTIDEFGDRVKNYADNDTINEVWGDVCSVDDNMTMREED